MTLPESSCYMLKLNSLPETDKNMIKMVWNSEFAYYITKIKEIKLRIRI